jgi:hypothetical protein
LELIVYALLQSQSGAKMPKPALVHQIHLDNSASLVQPQDNGTTKTIHVSVPHQQLNGMVLSASAQLEDMDLIV